MSDERDKVRCQNCELVQWSDRVNCRQRVVIRQDPQCLQKLEQAHRLISAATERLQQPGAEEKAPILFSQISEAEAFPTMAEMERAIIVAAYERSNRKPLEAARLLGIGKTTVYRKLREMGEAAA